MQPIPWRILWLYLTGDECLCRTGLSRIENSEQEARPFTERVFVLGRRSPHFITKASRWGWR